MGTNYPTQKLCATCEYWSGSRELSSTRSQLKADDKGTYKCFESNYPVKKQIIAVPNGKNGVLLNKRKKNITINTLPKNIRF